MDETGKITGYKTCVGGADTVFPFSSDIIVHPFHTASYYTFERDAKDVYVFARDNSGAPLNINGVAINFKQSNVLSGEAGTGGRGSYMHRFGPVQNGDIIYAKGSTWMVY